MGKARKKRQDFVAPPAASVTGVEEAGTLPPEAASVGVLLREARQGQGLSLMEMHESTRISLRVLAAIEEDDHASIPIEIYGSALVGLYAKSLGLDGRELAARFRAERGGVAGLNQVKNGLEASKLAEATSISPATNALLLFSGIFLVVGIFTASTGWNPLGYIFNDRGAAVSAQVMDYHPAHPGTSVEATSKAINLEVRFLKDTRVRLRVDQQQDVQVTYTRESVANWEADEALHIEFMEPASAELRLNGQPLGFPLPVNGHYRLHLKATPSAS